MWSNKVVALLIPGAQQIKNDKGLNKNKFNCATTVKTRNKSKNEQKLFILQNWLTKGGRGMSL